MSNFKNTSHAPFIDGLMTGLANAKRRRIVRILLKGEVSVGTLASMVSLSQSALSQHLKKLRDIKVVTTRRDAQTIYYSCDHPDALRLISLIEDIAQGKHSEALSMATPSDSEKKLAAFLSALDEWGCGGNRERAQHILEFQRAGYDHDAYLVEHPDRGKLKSNDDFQALAIFRQ